jgi:uncharacterized protein
MGLNFSHATSRAAGLQRKSSRVATFVRAGTAALFLAATASAHAQAPSAGAVAAARELIVVKGGALMFEPVIPGVIETAKNSLVPTNPNLSRELNDVATQLRKDYDTKKAELVYEVAVIYANHFTEQELKELVTFYKSPLGQKMLKEEPAALDQSMKRAQDWSSDFSDMVLARIRTEMAKRGHPL